MSRSPFRNPTVIESNLLDKIGDLTARLSKAESALRSAKRVLSDERREQLSCFTICGAKATKAEYYAQMNAGERAAIRRFDRAIAKINGAIR